MGCNSYIIKERQKMGFLTCLNSENFHEHDLSPSSHKIPELPSVNIGIYLDENSITVGTIETRNIPEIILQIPAGITFFNEQIVIGGNVEKNQQESNYFPLKELIKDISQQTPKIVLNSAEFSLSKEEVLVIFFQKLLFQIKSRKNVKSVEHVVFSSLLALTSLEKERLKISLEAAGVTSVRIVSSLLTTAIAHAGEINFYTRTPEIQKSLFVAQYTETSFFLSIVDITQDFIATKRCFSSANLIESQDGAFMQYHKSLFNNRTLKPTQAHYVLKAYKKACRVLCSEKTLKKINLKILKPSGQNCFLDDILSSIFDEVNVQEAFAKSGPLTGACLLASKRTPGSVLPSSVSVCDAGFTNLIFSQALSTTKRSVRKIGNFCPRLILDLKVPAALIKPTDIVLQEEFLKNKLFTTVGKYSLRIKNQMRSGVAPVRLKCLIDQDGIFRVELGDRELDAIWTRLNDPNVKFGEDSPVNSILSYYQSIQEIATTEIAEAPVELNEVSEETADETRSLAESGSESEAEFYSANNTQFTAQGEAIQEDSEVPEVAFPSTQISSVESESSESEEETLSDRESTKVEPNTEKESTEIESVKELAEVVSEEEPAEFESGKEIAEKPYEELFFEEYSVPPQIKIFQDEADVKNVTEPAENLSQMFDSIRSYNFGTATLKNKTDLWLIEAEFQYDSSIMEFKPKEKSRSGIQRIHERLKVDAVDDFKLKFRKHGLELKQDLLDDLETNLNNKFQKLIDGLGAGNTHDIFFREMSGSLESSL
ncbi:unnamed protein product [Allacma fusca]|uniref:Uncharacterized protein n=1 Tax=Allacma fusca TaxID=39272 RepID=A0A8J2LKN8_9HEXA|nr:unnamed protein product [Allacma fusca]